MSEEKKRLSDSKKRRKLTFSRILMNLQILRAWLTWMMIYRDKKPMHSLPEGLAEEFLSLQMKDKFSHLVIATDTKSLGKNLKTTIL